jgi:hypothetical protein
MLPGLNTDVAADGCAYHVQTEDLGEKNPMILTLVYKGGAVVLRERLEYGEIFGGKLSAPQIKTLMEAQHRRVMRRVAAGDLAIEPDARLREASVAPPPRPLSGPPPSSAPDLVDDLIEAYLRTRRQTTPRQETDPHPRRGTLEAEAIPGGG